MTEAPTKGALALEDFPGDVVRIACDHCGRKGQYRRDGLIARFGAAAPLPDVLNDIAACPRVRDCSNPCGAHYPDLAGQRPPSMVLLASQNEAKLES